MTIPKMRNFEGYADMTEEEVRKNIDYMLRNNPELIPGLDGEEMPTIRNAERIHEALTIRQINNDRDWLNALNFYAMQHGMSPDDALREEARRIALGETSLREETVIDTAAYIQMRQMQQKANDRGLTLEEMIEKDAQWIINKKIEEGKLFQ